MVLPCSVLNLASYAMQGPRKSHWSSLQCLELAELPGRYRQNPRAGLPSCTHRGRSIISCVKVYSIYNGCA
jgi:hypothetical protein